MARIKYQYNAGTCKYEPVYLKGKALRKQTFIFIALSLGLAIGAFIFHINYFDSFDEQLLRQENKTLYLEWSVLEERLMNANRELSAFVEKDDHNYRVILDTQPLPQDVREAGVGGSVKVDKEEIREYPFLIGTYERLEKFRHKLDIEVQSYDELKKLAAKRIDMWASRPAIQPISNKQLDRLHLSYGTRLHPIFNVWKAHKGLDFTASHGTPVYATGDGKVTMAYFSDSYGNVIYLDHSYNFETRYAHLSGFNVSPGQQVKRGQVIGFVGSTGTSAGSHLHYEVLIHNEHVNPINFFQRDLSNKEYEKLIRIGSEQTTPLD